MADTLYLRLSIDNVNVISFVVVVQTYRVSNSETREVAQRHFQHSTRIADVQEILCVWLQLDKGALGQVGASHCDQVTLLQQQILHHLPSTSHCLLPDMQF